MANYGLKVIKLGNTNGSQNIILKPEEREWLAFALATEGMISQNYTDQRREIEIKMRAIRNKPFYQRL